MTFQETLEKKMFWDSDFEKLDLQKHKRYIIERVLERALSWQQFKLMVDYYGDKEVIDLIKNVSYLTDLTINFCNFYFDIPLNEMRCYTRKQSLPKLWH
jgi:hypothetical protein